MGRISEPLWNARNSSDLEQILRHGGKPKAANFVTHSKLTVCYAGKSEFLGHRPHPGVPPPEIGLTVRS
jgi:hypothetical protein